MDYSTIDALKIIFLLGFTLHNLEEVIWLPKWSKYAGKYHKPVESDQFVFAVIIITLVGYILTTFDILAGDIYPFVRYIYLGFIGMMGLNSIFPHLLSTIVLKKYCPGLMTGLLLNLPLSVIILLYYMRIGINVFYLGISIIIVSVLIVASLKYLFDLGKSLIQYR